MFKFFQNKKPNQIENHALKLSLEFGKNWGESISERLLLKFPNLSQEELDFYNKLSKEVENDCWNCIENDTPQINISELYELLNIKVFAKYDWINESNQRNIKSKFSYYFWKDGRIS
ncbi:hypothetical protein [Kaistella sp.]|uniref:hypothetical protein n=1 Tax=Kaistella sp. TaxID=2782235 RepID=UPI003C36FACB